MNFEDKIRIYLNTLDLDLRKKPAGFSRYMDQKVTPDVLMFIADCVVNFLGGKSPQLAFKSKDLWDFPYFSKNVVAIYSKPSPTNQKAKNEYNKFIAQPLKTLAFAKILEEKKDGRDNTYTVLQPDLLNDIAQNEHNAWLFLVAYVEKVFLDSGFTALEIYKNKVLSGEATIIDFNTLKSRFKAFTLGYTNIQSTYDINRIFPKVLNPYAAFYLINGTAKGKMSKNRFTYSDLGYNRTNFRDLGKEKALTRQESSEIFIEKPELFSYKVQKAKNTIRRNHSVSEVKDSLGNGEATQVHHIFPENEFPQISAYVENLILLTPQQHNTKAHPSNHTQLIDQAYQKECLLSKIDSIELSLKQGKDIYSKESFIYVLNVGLKIDLSTSTTFEELRSVVNKLYV